MNSLGTSRSADCVRTSGRSCLSDRLEVETQDPNLTTMAHHLKLPVGGKSKMLQEMHTRLLIGLSART